MKNIARISGKYKTSSKQKRNVFIDRISRIYSKTLHFGFFSCHDAFVIVEIKARISHECFISEQNKSTNEKRRIIESFICTKT